MKLKIDKNSLQAVAKQIGIDLTDDEASKILPDFQVVIDSMKSINEVDVSSFPPISFPYEISTWQMDEDIALTDQKFVSNVRKFDFFIDDYFLVTKEKNKPNETDS